MTALPLPSQRLPLTVAQYVALGEDPDGVRYELVEGALAMSPKPTTAHQVFIYELMKAVEGQAPDHLQLVHDIDIDLQLAPPDHPGFVRAPDVVVVPRAAVARQRRDGGLLTAGDLVLAVEVISPGSRRLDTVVKRDEYADAGIPHYWVVDLGDLDNPVTLTAHHLAGEFGYATAGPVCGTFTATEPFPVRIALDALV